MSQIPNSPVDRRRFLQLAIGGAGSLAPAPSPSAALSHPAQPTPPRNVQVAPAN